MQGNNASGNYGPLGGGIMPNFGLAPGPPNQQFSHNDLTFPGLPPSLQTPLIQASGYDRPPPSLAPGAPIGSGVGGMGVGGSVGGGGAGSYGSGDDGSAGSGGGPPGPPVPPQFQCPTRPNIGMEGRAIVLKANHFKVGMPSTNIHYYQIEIQPDKCPRKVNR